jgi:Mitochondrial K+-H+ exchange-related
LLIDQERFFFYSDESESSHDEGEGDDSSSPARPGLRGWIHARYLRFKSAWQHADSGALLWMRRAWDWLHSLTRPDETMLARLRSARRIDLHHPAARPGDEVSATWQGYLTRQWRRHLIWMSINGVIAPFSVIFAILPGPNLIGYWFAYRAIHHLLVVWGIRRVRRNKILTELHPLAALDLPIEYYAEGKATHVALNFAAVRLDEHVVWYRSSHRTQGENRPPVTTTPTEPQTTHNQPEKP